MKKVKQTFRNINVKLLQQIVKIHPYLATKEELDDFITKQIAHRCTTLGIGAGLYLFILGLLLQDKPFNEALLLSFFIFIFGAITVGSSNFVGYVVDYPFLSFFYLRKNQYYWGLTYGDLEALYSQNTQFKIFKELEEIGIKKFCRKYFNKSSPGFLKFYQDRALPLEIHGRAFINYSLSVPRAKEMSVDMLRKVLLCYDPVFKSSVVNLDVAFKNYSLGEIERIFTTPSSKSCLLLHEFKEPLPLAKKFSELERLILKRAIPNNIGAIHLKEIDGFNFRVLMTQSEYNEISDLFSNCVRGYWGERDTFIIVAYKKLFPIACIEMHGGSIKQVSGMKNRDVFDKNTLLKALNQGQSKFFFFRSKSN